MRRRLVLHFVIALLAAPLTAEAQSTGKVYRIGFLSQVTAAASAPYVEAFRQGLREPGSVEGQNILLELRYAEGRSERFQNSLPNWRGSRLT